MRAIKSLSFLLLIWLFSSGWNQQIKQDALIGTWLTSKGECKIRIYESNGKYFGKVVWLEEPNDEKGNPFRDIQNPDPKLRNNPTLGIKLLKNFSYDGNGKWTGGTIYNPENGKTYHAQIKMNNYNRLDLKGFIGIPALGLTSHWTRTN